MASAFFGSQSACSSAPAAATVSTYCTPGRTPIQLHHQQSSAPRPPVPPSNGSRLPSPAQVLPWRPPATRRFLWDRTPQGPAVVSDLGGTKVRLSVAASSWKLLQRLHLGEEGTVTLTGRLTAASAGGLEVELGTGQPGAADITVPVLLERSSGAATQQPQAEQLSEAYELGCSKQQGAGVAQLLQAAATSSTAGAGGLELRGVAALPAALVTYKPILAKSISPQPLSRALQVTLRGARGQPFQDGYLSMDQGRSLVPIAANDPVAHAVPLVGVWVVGVDGVRHPLVGAACIKYLCNKTLVDKALEMDSSFLVLLYCPGRAVPLCFECHVGLEAGAVPLKALAFAAAAQPPALNTPAWELTPLQGVSLQGCPATAGRHQGAGNSAAQMANERHSWHSARRQLPGSAGSGLSVTSARPNCSALQTGESPSILPVCAPRPRPLGANGCIGLTACDVPSQEGVSSAGGGLLKPELVAAVATACQPGASPAAQWEQGSSQGRRSRQCTYSMPPGGAADDLQQVVPEPPSLTCTEPAGEQLACTPGEQPPEVQQSTAAPTAGPSTSSKGGSAGEAGPALHGGLDSCDEVARPGHTLAADVIMPAAATEPSFESSGRGLSCEPAQCEECSGSMPSLAGWSSSFKPLDQASSANSLNVPPAPQNGGAEQELPPRQQEQAPALVPSPAAAETRHPAGTQGLPGPVYCTGTVTAMPVHPFTSPAMFGCGGNWVLQPAVSEFGLSQDVVALQQEVIILRQQVKMLQLQLQECQMGLQAAMPLMMPPHFLAYSDSWGLPMPAMPWQQPGVQLFAQGAGACTPQSFQQSCTGEFTPTSHQLLPGGQPAPQSSPAAASEVAANAALGVSPAEAVAGWDSEPREVAMRSPMKPTPREASPSTVQADDGSFQLVPQRQAPHCAAPQNCTGSPCGEHEAVPAPQTYSPSGEPTGPREPQSDEPCPASSLRTPAGVATAAAAAPMPVAGPSPAAAQAPGGVGEAEADIDRLIEHAERAMSMLSFRSADGAGVEDRVMEWLGSTADPPDPPCRPVVALSSGSWVAAGAAAAAPMHPMAMLGSAGQAQQAASICSWGSGGSGLPGVVRVQLPSFLNLEGADDDEDDDEVERLEQKYGLGKAGSRC